MVGLILEKMPRGDDGMCSYGGEGGRMKGKLVEREREKDWMWVGERDGCF